MYTVKFKNGRWVFKGPSFESENASFDRLLTIVSGTYANADKLVKADVQAAFDTAAQSYGLK